MKDKLWKRYPNPDRPVHIPIEVRHDCEAEVKLYYDPDCATLVTESGERVEGVRTIVVSTEEGEPTTVVVFDRLAVVPVPKRALVDDAVAGLQKIEESLGGSE